MAVVVLVPLSLAVRAFSPYAFYAAFFRCAEIIDAVTLFFFS